MHAVPSTPVQTPSKRPAGPRAALRHRRLFRRRDAGGDRADASRRARARRIAAAAGAAPQAPHRSAPHRRTGTGRRAAARRARLVACGDDLGAGAGCAASSVPTCWSRMVSASTCGAATPACSRRCRTWCTSNTTRASATPPGGCADALAGATHRSHRRLFRRRAAAPARDGHAAGTHDRDPERHPPRRRSPTPTRIRSRSASPAS